VLVALVFPTLAAIVYFVLLAGHPPGSQQAAYLVGKVLQFGFPVVWVWLVQRNRPEFRWPTARELGEGGALGAVILATMLVLYFAWLRRGGLPPEVVEGIRRKVSGMDMASPTRFIALGAFYALGHSLLEEYYWRWFVFGQLQALTALPTALAFSAIGFMAHHVCVLAQLFGWNSPLRLFLTVFLSASVAMGGVLWALLYRRHGSLYGVWLSHLLVDAGIFIIGYDLVLT
jgi:membrane protease YdiL (CAAX protease family)